MPSIGDFDAAARELVHADDVEPTTFGWCGTTIRLVDDVGVYPLLRFFGDLTGATASQELAAEHAFLQTVIHPDDWATFERVSSEHAVTTTTITELIKAIITGATGRPTSRPAGSPDGPPTTTENSRDGSRLRILPGFEGMPTVDEVLEDLAGEDLASYG